MYDREESRALECGCHAQDEGKPAMRDEGGFTVMELLAAIFSLCMFAVGCYMIYLVIGALQKYIAS